MSTSRIILAIDPGYDRLGWAIMVPIKNNINILACDCIQTDKNTSFSDRYNYIIKNLIAICQEYKPTELALESVFFSVNKKTAIRVSEVRGVIIAICLNFGLQLFEYNPSQVKLAVTGNGNADKASVEKMVRLMFKMGDAPFIDDTLDAIAIGATHIQQVKIPIIGQSK